MALYQIAPHVYMMDREPETDRPHLYYIKGKDYSVAIDAGNSAAHVHKFYGELMAQGLPLPRVTLITHWHWDHTFGMHAVPGLCRSSVKTAEKLKEVQTWVWTGEAMAERERTGEDIAFCNEHILAEYEHLSDIKVVLPKETVEEDVTLFLGDLHLKLMPRDSTHSRDALFVLLEEDRCLFVGDADCGDFYELNESYDPDRLDAMIAYFESLDYDLHLIGHGDIRTKEQALAGLREEKRLLEEKA